MFEQERENSNRISKEECNGLVMSVGHQLDGICSDTFAHPGVAESLSALIHLLLNGLQCIEQKDRGDSLQVYNSSALIALPISDVLSRSTVYPEADATTQGSAHHSQTS